MKLKKNMMYLANSIINAFMMKKLQVIYLFQKFKRQLNFDFVCLILIDDNALHFNNVSEYRYSRFITDVFYLWADIQNVNLYRSQLNVKMETIHTLFELFCVSNLYWVSWILDNSWKWSSFSRLVYI